jgi:pSer/pThr/pTyr-binding forkhead associated (FHA) protein
MADRNELAAYTSSQLNFGDDAELQERLRLYQVFLKLYEHHQGLLNEILNLENSYGLPVKYTTPYVQGLVSGAQGYVITNLEGGKTQALTQPQQIWTIGRDPRQSLICVQDIRLSRCHAALKYIDGQGFYLIDLGSRNHSFINGEPVRHALLKDGDQVRMGSITFSFFLCQTTRMLDPLSSVLLNKLEHWQPYEGDSNVLEPLVLDAGREEVEESIPTLDLYHDTSGFLRSEETDQPLF